ncbi:hypothetical protein LQW54_007492 [Pestalotiopsis sp. IQ-011]
MVKRTYALGLFAQAMLSLAAEPDYSKDHPYTIPAKPNGLAIEKPNMILFMPDQLRFDSVGIFGNDIVQTPNIDAFARQGVRFTNTFAQASVCSQSRTAMFTGQYPHVSGHRSLENLLKPWEPNVFKALKDQGYHVAYLAPRGDLYAEDATELGVNEYGFLTNQTLPSFIGEGGFDLSEGENSIWNRLFYIGPRPENQTLDYDEMLTQGALKWLETPHSQPWTGYSPRYMDAMRESYGLDRATPEIWQEVIATYYGMISRVDWQFGRVVNKTKELGLWNETITFFFTDHGEFLGDYGLIEKWPSAVTGSLTHDPLIIGGGTLPENVSFDEMAEMVDLVPTLLQFSSRNTTYAQYGKSWVDGIHALGRGEVLAHKDYTFTEGGFLLNEEPLLEQSPFPYDIKAGLQHNHTEIVGKAIAVRDKSWTYIYRLYEQDELYSRQGDDPHEAYNLASQPDYQDVRARLREVILKWLFQTTDVMPWYKDERSPEVVDLKSPWDQYQERLGEL